VSIRHHALDLLVLYNYADRGRVDSVYEMNNEPLARREHTHMGRISEHGYAFQRAVNE